MLEKEIWKPIIIEKNGILYDYTGFYEVSNLGRIRGLDRLDASGHKISGKILKPRINNLGYQTVGLCKNSKKKFFSIHRLVATAFIPNPDNLPVVNHRDENPSNNCVDNLEWCTQKYNVNYGTCQEKHSEKIKGDKHPMYGRTGDKNPMAKKVICLETKQVFDCTREAEDWCGKKGVSCCCRGKTNKCGGYHWQFLDDYLREQRMNTDINNSKLVA